METDSNFLSATWLKPIIGLLRAHNFGEAYALAEYFPATPSRKLVQCVALLYQKKPSGAEILLETLSVKPQALAADFILILGEVSSDHTCSGGGYEYWLSPLAGKKSKRCAFELVRGIIAPVFPQWISAHICTPLMSKYGSDTDLLKAGHIAIKNKHLTLGQLYLEAHLLTHPEAVQTVSDGLMKIITQALITDNSQACMTCLDRIIELDNTPSRLSQLATSLLAVARNSNNFQFELDFLSKLSSYNYDKEENTNEIINAKIENYVRGADLYVLLRKYSQVPTIWLELWLKMLFQTDLKLREYDVKFIYQAMDLLPDELKGIIQKGLDKQVIRKDDVRFQIDLDAVGVWGEEPHTNLPSQGQFSKGEKQSQSKIPTRERSVSCCPTGERSVSLNADWYQPSSVIVKRHTRIDFPAECVIDRRVELRVQLTKDIPKLTRVLEYVHFPVSEGTKQVTLDGLFPRGAQRDRRKEVIGDYSIPGAN